MARGAVRIAQPREAWVNTGRRYRTVTSSPLNQDALTVTVLTGTLLQRVWHWAYIEPTGSWRLLAQLLHWWSHPLSPWAALSLALPFPHVSVSRCLYHFAFPVSHLVIDPHRPINGTTSADSAHLSSCCQNLVLIYCLSPQWPRMKSTSEIT